MLDDNILVCQIAEVWLTVEHNIKHPFVLLCDKKNILNGLVKSE